MQDVMNVGKAIKNDMVKSTCSDRLHLVKMVRNNVEEER